MVHCVMCTVYCVKQAQFVCLTSQITNNPWTWYTEHLPVWGLAQHLLQVIFNRISCNVYCILCKLGTILLFHQPNYQISLDTVHSTSFEFGPALAPSNLYISKASPRKNLKCLVRNYNNIQIVNRWDKYKEGDNYSYITQSLRVQLR